MHSYNFVILTRRSADMGQTGRTLGLVKNKEKDLVKTGTEARGLDAKSFSGQLPWAIGWPQEVQDFFWAKVIVSQMIRLLYVAMNPYGTP